jgi:hypothetical protein
MKFLVALLFAFSACHGYSQSIDTTAGKINKDSTRANFVAYFDKGRETKDGFYLNGYVVNISRERAKELHGKKIRVKGKVTIHKGLSNDPNEPITQGRAVDTKHIENPSITILKQP